MNDIAEDDVIDVYIGNGSSISGDLQSYGKVVIEGTMDGTIHAQSMTIGKTGKVAGAATVDDADIAGRFANALEVDGTLMTCH